MRTPSAASCAKLIGIVARATPLGPKATLAQLLITQTALELLAELREFYGSFRIALTVSNSAPTRDDLDVATLRAPCTLPFARRTLPYPQNPPFTSLEKVRTGCGRSTTGSSTTGSCTMDSSGSCTFCSVCSTFTALDKPSTEISFKSSILVTENPRRRGVPTRSGNVFA